MSLPALRLTTCFIISFLQRNTDSHTFYYQSYHVPRDHDEALLSIRMHNLDIDMDSLLNITINHQLQLNYFNDAHWNEINRDIPTAESMIARRRLSLSTDAHRYAVSGIKMKWADGLRYCNLHYHSMASIMSPSDNKAAMKACPNSHPFGCWIGLGGGGRPRWSNGKKVRFEKYRLQPTTSFLDGTNCINVDARNGIFDEYRCYHKLYVLCDKSYSSARYALSPVPMNWADGRRYCNQHHASMASIRSLSENNEAHNVCPRYCWIGLREEAGRPMVYRHWDNHRNVEFTHWDRGEPNNNMGSGKECVLMHRSTGGRWWDFECHKNMYVLCDKKEGNTAKLYGNYIAVQSVKTYNDADTFCLERYGTHLATVHSFWDNEQVKHACNQITGGNRNSKNADCWIGLRSPFKKWQDGIYATGWDKFNGWYDKQPSGDITRWKLILRLKNTAKGYFSKQLKHTGMEHPKDPDANTYCIIGQINSDNYKSAKDDKYQFKLVYKYGDGGEDTLIWKQKSWLEQSRITEYEAIQVSGEHASLCASFGGLGYTEVQNSCSYLDGNGAHHCWWNSVGTMCSWRGGIPAYNGKIATSQALYIYMQERNSDICAVIHSDSRWYDKPCHKRKPFVCNAMSYSERLSPMMRHALQRQAYMSHYAQWMDFKQLQHMKALMKEMREQKVMAPYHDPYWLHKQREKEKQKQIKAEKWERDRHELREKGIFKPYEDEGYFHPSNLDSIFGSGHRYVFPVKWEPQVRRLIDGNSIHTNPPMKCVWIGVDDIDANSTDLYDVCVGLDELYVKRYLFYVVNNNNTWMGDAWMDIEQWKYKQMMTKHDENDRNDKNDSVMVYRLHRRSHIDDTMEYTIAHKLIDDDDGLQCLTPYICLVIKRDTMVSIERIRMHDENESAVMLDFSDDNQWNEIHYQHNIKGDASTLVGKCVHLYDAKICIQASEGTQDKATDVSLYKASIVL